MISINSGYEYERVIEWLAKIGIFLSRMEIVDLWWRWTSFRLLVEVRRG
ncbi:hypothetical protein NC653_007222 [Populus alba x Populus x berolinensis]|uniref:Uncharacterized protein n=1 Tax=Populus alba x Populus x berolinensis TaxID=444605 RepID=A0AAD6RH03_9ROSI|nr:hypothetical protein NC653_007222 [Populus alba x Populus x berolinensis]